MPNKMLIDATHPEETRVVVVRGNRVEEFDFESAQRKQLRSLQAAFIEYGGNRHGFLAFSEIHPDYYQIPVADRQALIEADERAHREAEEDADNRSSRRRPRHRSSRRRGGGERVQSDIFDATNADGTQTEAAVQVGDHAPDFPSEAAPDHEQHAHDHAHHEHHDDEHPHHEERAPVSTEPTAVATALSEAGVQDHGHHDDDHHHDDDQAHHDPVATEIENAAHAEPEPAQAVAP
ncbi:MAG: ribonuclease E/G, partial [Afipia sp.]|nr:ribonuclease E/G [Afipia sp.]